MKLDLTNLDTINALRNEMLKIGFCGISSRDLRSDDSLKWGTFKEGVWLALRQGAWIDESWGWHEGDVVPKDGYDSRYVKCSLSGYFMYDVRHLSD
jgi:hypothetical protein